MRAPAASAHEQKKEMKSRERMVLISTQRGPELREDATPPVKRL